MKTESILDLKRIAEAGGGLELDGSEISTLDLERLAEAAAEGGGQLVLRNMKGRSTLDLVRVAKAAPGHVLFSPIPV